MKTNFTLIGGPCHGETVEISKDVGYIKDYCRLHTLNHFMDFSGMNRNSSVYLNPEYYRFVSMDIGMDGIKVIFDVFVHDSLTDADEIGEEIMDLFVEKHLREKRTRKNNKGIIKKAIKPKGTLGTTDQCPNCKHIIPSPHCSSNIREWLRTIANSIDPRSDQTHAIDYLASIDRFVYKATTKREDNY